MFLLTLRVNFNHGNRVKIKKIPTPYDWVGIFFENDYL